MKRIDFRKSKRQSPFDPKVFLGTEDGGRTIFKYKKGHALFVQGGPADAVFYIRNGKVKITVVSEQGKESRRRNSGAGRILRRRMLDRAGVAPSDSRGNDGMRDHAAGEGNHDPGHP